ncbi:MAG: hypothetical protein QOJ42_7264, partial [Acidobacteriaceae bacterium]|nr:hypothetical protein [Acidobacteriaceae bacterium]
RIVTALEEFRMLLRIPCIDAECLIPTVSE